MSSLHSNMALIVRLDRISAHGISTLVATLAALGHPADRVIVVHPASAEGDALAPLRDLANLRPNPTGDASDHIVVAAAREADADVLILDADCRPAPGMIEALFAAAEPEGMFGFACPRFSSGGPHAVTWRGPHTPDEDISFFTAFARIAPHLPARTYVPLVDPACVLISRAVLRAFAAGGGIGLPDLVLAARRCGYAILEANRAGAWRASSTPVRKPLPAPNDPIERERIEAHISFLACSPITLAEQHLPALAADRHRILIDVTALPRQRNGTGVLIEELCRAFSAIEDDHFELALYGKAEQLAALPSSGLRHVPSSMSLPNGWAAAVMKIGQPQNPAILLRANRLAPVNVHLVLDTIACDCLQSYEPGSARCLAAAMATADGVIYNSFFTRDQYRLRFPRPFGLQDLVSHHSLDPTEYRLEAADPLKDASETGHVFIVGNSLPHKFVAETYGRLSACMPETRFYLLGGSQVPLKAGDVRLDAGQTSETKLHSAYSGAQAVVFPSHYEGFGFPTMISLAYHVPVFVRDTGINREIAAATGSADIHFYATEEDLARAITEQSPRATSSPNRQHNWRASAKEILDFIGQLIETHSLETTAERTTALKDRLGAGRHGSSDDFEEDGLSTYILKARLAVLRAKRLAVLPWRAKRRATAAEIRVIRARLELIRNRPQPQQPPERFASD